MNRKFFVVLMSSLFIFACGEKLPTIDSRTEETYKESMRLVVNSIPQEERKAFDLSLDVFSWGKNNPYLPQNEVAYRQSATEQDSEQLKKVLNEKNYKQIIKKAGKIERRKIQESKREYRRIIKSLGKQLVSLENISPFNQIKISQRKMGMMSASLIVENQSSVDIGEFIVCAIDQSGAVPFVAIARKELDVPLQPQEKRIVPVSLDPLLGWGKHISGKQAIVSAKWIIFHMESADKSRLFINEHFAQKMREISRLRRKYDSLL